MKKTTTKKMTYGGAKTMSKGGKATAKPKMAGGGTAKKKYAMAGVVSTTEACNDGDKKCRQKKSFRQMRNEAPKAINTTTKFRRG